MTFFYFLVTNTHVDTNFELFSEISILSGYFSRKGGDKQSWINYIIPDELQLQLELHQIFFNYITITITLC